MEVNRTYNFLLSIHEKVRGRKTIPYFRKLCQTQCWDVERLRNHQLQKLRRLLTHSRGQVPYYQKLFKTIDIKSFDTLVFEDYQKIPTLSKDEIRSNLMKFTSANYNGKLIKYSTGGSTGEPLVFYTDKEKEANHNAHKLRARTWFAILPGDKQVDFWGSPIELSKLSHFRSWKDRWFLNYVLLSAFDLKMEKLRSYVDFLRRFQPKLIYGYPTVIYRVAQFILDTPTAIGSYRPKLVSCTAEMLYDYQRNVIKEAFGCPVVNEYGSRDGGLIAHECPAGRLHIAAEHVLVEVDNVDKNGVGDLLITNLDGYGMPLLRYRIGDRGKLGSAQCDCGLSLPVLDQLAGRSNDFLVGRNGKLIHSLAPIYVLREISKLKQFKVIQRKQRQLEIQMVSHSSFDDAELDEIRQKMEKIFEQDLDVNFVFKESIDPEKSGKYRWVVSEVEAGSV